MMIFMLYTPASVCRSLLKSSSLPLCRVRRGGLPGLTQLRKTNGGIVARERIPFCPAQRFCPRPLPPPPPNPHPTTQLLAAILPPSRTALESICVAFRDRKVCTQFTSVLHCLEEGAATREKLTWRTSHPPFFPSQANPGAGAGPGDGERGSYRLRVIKALVQRYIETARREFEETRQKGWLLTSKPSSPLQFLAG